jgi:hypothetical protein
MSQATKMLDAFQSVGAHIVDVTITDFQGEINRQLSSGGRNRKFQADGGPARGTGQERIKKRHRQTAFRKYHRPTR